MRAELRQGQSGVQVQEELFQELISWIEGETVESCSAFFCSCFLLFMFFHR